MFGNILTGITAPYNTVSFTGHEYDKGSGLTYMNARWYDSQVGRFTSMDTYFGTLTNPQSQNLYAYVLNNPVNMWDPSGNVPYWVGKSIHTEDDSDGNIAHIYFLEGSGSYTTGWSLISRTETIHEITYRYRAKRTEYWDYDYWRIYWEKVVDPDTGEEDWDISGHTRRNVRYTDIDYYYKTEVVKASEIYEENEEFIRELAGEPPGNDDAPTFSVSGEDDVITSVGYYGEDGNNKEMLNILQIKQIIPDNPQMSNTNLRQIEQAVFEYDTKGYMVGKGIQVAATDGVSLSQDQIDALIQRNESRMAELNKMYEGTSNGQVPWYNNVLNAGIDYLNAALDKAYEASSYISPYTQAGMNLWKDYSPIYWAFQYSTQEGWFSEAFDVAGFYMDAKGIYHAKQSDSLQSWKYSGYNNLYDGIFNSATSMDRAKFQFSDEDQEKEYVFWAWKGDYLNLGAGAEMGIYTRMVVNGKPTEHWLVDQSNAMPMTLNLEYEGKPIITYDPKKDDPEGQSPNKWWVTGFNPKYQNKQANELTAIFTVDFSDKKDMYNAFIKSDAYLNNKNKWSISEDNKYKMIFTFR